MIQNIKQLYGRILAASDGDVGHVKDFYFDDQSWAVRYVVADTGSWLATRQVLLSPHAFIIPVLGESNSDDKELQVNLTLKQIEDSPLISSYRSVSRQDEEACHLYYGWPTYWSEGRKRDVTELPSSAPQIPQARSRHGADQPNNLLRRTKAVTGYQIQASDGPAGSLRGFMVDRRSWVIQQLVIKIGHWYAGETILLRPENIDRITHDDCTVFVNATKEDLKRSSRNDCALAATG